MLLDQTVLGKSTLGKALKQLDMILKDDPLPKAKRDVLAHFQLILTEAIKLAYPSTRNPRTHQCQLEFRPLFSSINRFYSLLGWRQPYFHAALWEYIKHEASSELIGILCLA
eukprot:CAMPEP_0201558636 /NCGR_PEP_ID=MMETSP0173_2-20130828/69089_1 /ASSEMBLY_ACC=CAM_ASM_000268 /TAXON_ID=218659 /ORGANISM="Vexillifera sp., Strain DIVA3 564/2" /LENGTH=111 /DNA_ID=CAMNT_0047972145 /DNA_START=27 /DNA_END=358 /DNA_ORIENTATION=+